MVAAGRTSGPVLTICGHSWKEQQCADTSSDHTLVAVYVHPSPSQMKQPMPNKIQMPSPTGTPIMRPRCCSKGSVPPPPPPPDGVGVTAGARRLCSVCVWGGQVSDRRVHRCGAHHISAHYCWERERRLGRHWSQHHALWIAQLRITQAPPFLVLTHLLLRPV